MTLTMLGHSTLLVEAGGSRIIVDPFFEPSSLAISRRVAPVAMTAQEAAAGCQLVLVTHAHPDHCDPAFFDALDANVPVLAPAGFRFLGGYRARQQVVELATWEARDIAAVRVTSTPAAHPGVACGFVVQADGKTLYLAGDTSFAPFFKEVGDRLRPDVAALPIKAFRMGPGLTSGNIVQATQALGVRSVIGIHLHLVMTVWPLKLDDPVPAVSKALHDGLPDVTFSAPSPGEQMVL